MLSASLDRARTSRLIHTESRAQKNFIRLARNNCSKVICGKLKWRLTSPDVRHVIDPAFVRSLADNRTVGRNNKLNSRKMLFKPKPNLALPLWVKMGVNLV